MKHHALILGLLLVGCSGSQFEQSSPRPSYDGDYAARHGAPPAASAAPLRAGEVDDNARFDEYVRYFRACPEPDSPSSRWRSSCSSATAARRRTTWGRTARTTWTT